MEEDRKSVADDAGTVVAVDFLRESIVVGSTCTGAAVKKADATDADAASEKRVIVIHLV